MVKMYIQTSSKQCINIVGRIREAILAGCGNGKISIFDKAAEQCNTLLEDESFPDFKKDYKPEESVYIKGIRIVETSFLSLPIFFFVMSVFRVHDDYQFLCKFSF